MKILSLTFHDANPKIGFSRFFSENYPHPFSNYVALESDIDHFKKTDFLEKVHSLHKKIKEEEKESQFYFQYEVNLCFKHSRAEYINSVLKELLIFQKRIERKNNSRHKRINDTQHKTYNHKNYFPLYQFLIDSLMFCIEEILHKHQEFLESELKNEVVELLKPKEPILSFQRTKVIPDFMLEDSFQRHFIKNGLIHPKTDFFIFKSLFQNESLKERIEWTSTLGALYYFITLLITENDKGERAVENPLNQHWKITSEFFSHRGGRPAPNLKRQKPPRNSLKRPIERFISDLHSLT